MSWRAAIPNALTLGNLACGVLAIIALSRYKQDALMIYYSGGLILLGALFDFFDGMVARLLRVRSPLGAQLDSLADVVTFGVAPALLLATAYFDILSMLFDKEEPNVWLGALMVLPLPLAAAFRLARFNTQGDSGNKHFEGLPSPAAGILATVQAYCFMLIGLALYISACSLNKQTPDGKPIVSESETAAWLYRVYLLVGLTALTTFALALAMVSRWPFLSFKGSAREKLALVAVFASGALVAWLTDFQPWVVLATLALYALVSRLLIRPTPAPPHAAQ